MRPGIAILLSCTMLSLLLAFLFAARWAGANQPDEAVAQGWDETVEGFVRRKVRDTYVDRLDDARAQDAFVRAMDAYVDFDAYCDFIPPPEYRQWKQDTAGRYAGLGVKILGVEDGLHIVGIFPGGPADRADLHVGDTIVRAAGTLLAGLGAEEITPLLKGPPGSAVRIGLVRGPRPEQGPASGPEEEVVVKRGVIRPPSVFARRVGPEGRFLQVRLTEFTEETGAEFAQEIDRLADGRPAHGIVLDLRHNGGGVLDVAVDVASRFLRAGKLVVRMEGRGRDATRNFAAPEAKGKVLDLPLVVLVDGSSASASEVVAGALQDHRRAVLVGTRTYGKFLVQSITEIPGKECAVKLTTSRYYTPSGRSYQGPARGSLLPGKRPEGAGLIPDVVIPIDDDHSLALQRFWAQEEGRPWNEVERWPELGPDWVDEQLQRALQLLEGEMVLQRIQQGSKPLRRNG